MNLSTLPFPLPNELQTLFGEYAATHKEIDPAGVIHYVAEKDSSGHKLVSLLQAVSAQTFANSDIWLTKTIERLDSASSSLSTNDQKIAEQIGSGFKKRKREEMLSPLYEACRDGTHEDVKLFLEAGADIKQRNGPNNETALHTAARNGHLECVQLLLTKKPDLNALTKSGETALYLALKGNHAAVAQLLLAADAHASLRNGPNSETSLHVAIEKGMCEMTQLLIAHKSDRNAQTKAGFSPLYLALLKGELEIAKDLLEAGVNVNLRNGPEYETALHVAARLGQCAMVILLLDQKSERDPVTKAGQRPIVLAQLAGHLDVVQILVEAGAQIDKAIMSQAKAELVMGPGIQNPGINACFMNATLQALRMCPPFRTFLKAQKAPLDELHASQKSLLWKELAISLSLYPGPFSATPTQDLREAYLIQALSDLKLPPELSQNALSLLSCTQDVRKKALGTFILASVSELMERLDNKKAESVDGDTMLALRHMMTIAGFPAVTPTSQEDAQEFMLYLLDILNAPSFHTKTAIQHELDFPVPPLEQQKEKRTCLLVTVSEAAKGQTLEQLITSNVIMEEIEKKAILHSESLKATEQQMASILKLPDIKEASTLQTISFKNDDIPLFLPISIKRYVKRAGSIQKVATSFPLSKKLNIPLDDDQTTPAQFTITSCVVHDGASPTSGHYRSYALIDEVWVEFNDTQVLLRKDKDAVESDIATNGYLFLYKKN